MPYRTSFDCIFIPGNKCKSEKTRDEKSLSAVCTGNVAASDGRLSDGAKKGAGTCTITARTHNGNTAKCTVNVSKAEPLPVEALPIRFTADPLNRACG